MTNAHAQDSVDEDTWPPDQPKNYTPLVLIQHQQQRTKQQDSELAKLTQTGDISSITDGQLAPKRQKLDSHETLQHVLDTSTVTKDVAEILTPLEESDGKRFLLIEGAPGIGKSVLLKHIACHWGKKLLLTAFKIVLLVCLRDSTIWQAKSISDLLCLFCEGYSKAKEISTVCSDYFFVNGGKDVAFLFDGYDKFPEDLQKSSLVAKILSRKLLPLCGIVVSSRPHASVNLRKLAVVRVDILGFTEQDRQHYIEQSVKGNLHQIKELTQYLHHHPTISDICFAPLNMSILLFLYQLGIPLPNNSTELHHHFIFQTIRRHLVKSGQSLKNTTTDLTTLPEPYKKVVKQLSKLSLEALNNNKLVFTSENIQATCPDMVSTAGGTNGFGLLQAVKHFSLTGQKTVTTYNFLHLTIQEYLAARYVISDLQQDEELDLLNKHFWSDLHANMFFIYVTLTNGQRCSFKRFLSDGDDKVAISSNFLEDQLKCLRLYRCFKEAGDDRMCKSIEEAEIFKKKEIDLSGTNLSATDLECLSLFITFSSYIQWVWLDLDSCYIQDRGLHFIHKYLAGSNLIINTLWLTNNGLTRSSSTFVKDIVLNCKVEQLGISYNSTIGKSRELYTMLTHHSSVLKILFMVNVSLSPDGARMLFTAVKDNNKLEELNLNHNAITDDVIEEITAAVSTNKSLVKLGMKYNPISGEAIISALQALRINNTLQELEIPSYSPAIEDRIKSTVQEINTKRKSREIQEILTVK